MSNYGIIQERIKLHMDAIQAIMESPGQDHLIEGKTDLLSHMAKVSLFTKHMNDEDKDYYQAVQWTLEEKEDWDVKK